MKINLENYINEFIKNNVSIKTKIEAFNLLFKMDNSSNEWHNPFWDEYKELLLKIVKDEDFDFEEMNEEYYVDDDNIEEYLEWIIKMDKDDVPFDTFELDVLYTFYLEIINEYHQIMTHCDLDTVDSNYWKMVKSKSYNTK